MSETPRTRARDFPMDDEVVDVRAYEKLKGELAEANRRIAKGQTWIPVSERLPEPRTTILAFECSGAPAEPVCIAFFNPAATMRRPMTHASPWLDAAGDCIDISHWMPLPEAPK